MLSQYQNLILKPKHLIAHQILPLGCHFEAEFHEFADSQTICGENVKEISRKTLLPNHHFK